MLMVLLVAASTVLVLVSNHKYLVTSDTPMAVLARSLDCSRDSKDIRIRLSVPVEDMLRKGRPGLTSPGSCQCHL